MARARNTKHHRKPRSVGGTSNHGNISMVTKKEHQAYHVLFSNKNPQEVARILTKKWIDHEWCLIACKKKNRRKKRG